MSDPYDPAERQRMNEEAEYPDGCWECGDETRDRYCDACYLRRLGPPEEDPEAVYIAAVDRREAMLR